MNHIIKTKQTKLFFPFQEVATEIFFLPTCPLSYGSSLASLWTSWLEIYHQSRSCPNHFSLFSLTDVSKTTDANIQGSGKQSSVVCGGLRSRCRQRRPSGAGLLWRCVAPQWRVGNFWLWWKLYKNKDSLTNMDLTRSQWDPDNCLLSLGLLCTSSCFLGSP